MTAKHVEFDLECVLREYFGNFGRPDLFVGFESKHDIVQLVICLCGVLVMLHVVYVIVNTSFDLLGISSE